MRFIPTLVHGVADSLVGLTAVALPYVLGLHQAPRIVLVALGLINLPYSLAADCEFPVIRFLRTRFHLLLYAVFCIAMLLAPWIFNFPSDVCSLIGILAPLLALTTRIRAAGTAAINNK